MSTRKLIYKLEKELSFWQQVHKHEPKDEREFELERQLRQLSNPNEFGIPRNDGQIEDDEEYEYISVPRIICCRYCNKPNLKWMQIDGKWRLSDSDGLHTCKEYKMNHTGGQMSDNVADDKARCEKAHLIVGMSNHDPIDFIDRAIDWLSERYQDVRVEYLMGIGWHVVMYGINDVLHMKSSDNLYTALIKAVEVAEQDLKGK